MKPPKIIKFRTLEQILRRYGITLCSGSKHRRFVSKDGRWKYPIPDVTDVERSYVNGARRRFKLTAEDGVSDGEFYGKG